MSDIVAFMAARLDEDLKEIGLVEHDDGDCDWQEGMHLERARALREVEAKRKILAEHQSDGYYCERCHPDMDDASQMAAATFPCRTLRALASVWSDHPDYDPGWRS